MTSALRSAPVTDVRPNSPSNRVVSLDLRQRLHRDRQRTTGNPTVVVKLPRQTASQNAPTASTKVLPQLRFVRRATLAVGSVLTATTLAIYSGTVYSQQQWNRATRQLESLRHQERQIVVATEALRQHIANLSEARAAAFPSELSEDAVYLEPAAPRSVSHPPVPPTPPSAEFPLAY